MSENCGRANLHVAGDDSDITNHLHLKGNWFSFRISKPVKIKVFACEISNLSSNLSSPWLRSELRWRSHAVPGGPKCSWTAAAGAVQCKIFLKKIKIRRKQMHSSKISTVHRRKNMGGFSFPLCLLSLHTSWTSSWVHMRFLIWILKS